MDGFTSILMDLKPNDEYDRIIRGYEMATNNIPYTLSYIDLLIKYYELIEDYEKCDNLLKFKRSKIDSHDERYQSIP